MEEGGWWPSINAPTLKLPDASDMVPCGPLGSRTVFSLISVKLFNNFFTLCHIIFMVLVQRIWYWINQYPLIFSFSSSSWNCWSGIKWMGCWIHVIWGATSWRYLKFRHECQSTVWVTMQLVLYLPLEVQIVITRLSISFVCVMKKTIHT